MSEIFNLEKIFDVFNYIFSFFALNLLFMFFNIPVILFFLFVGISNIFNYFPLFLLCLLPTVPSFNILIYCVNKFFKNKDLNIISDFKKGFLLSFKQSIFIWAVELLLILALYSNIRFFKVAFNNTLLSCLFVGLLLLLILMTPFISLLVSLFSIKTLDIFKNSFILIFTRPILAITNILLLLMSLVLFEISPGTTVLFIASILSFMFVFANKTLIKELENLSKAQQ